MEISSRYLNPRAVGVLTEPAPQPCAELTVQELLEWLRQPQYTNGRLDEHAAEHMVSAATLIERLRGLLREPTPEMLDAAEQYNREHITGEWSFADCYRAMTRRALEPKP